MKHPTVYSHLKCIESQNIILKISVEHAPTQLWTFFFFSYTQNYVQTDNELREIK